jgi:bifunctional enzyme CysN/CysC
VAISEVRALPLQSAVVFRPMTDDAAAHPSDPYEMDLLRFTTAGSVDDGKSTLIGRLLYDTRSIFEDQLEALTEATRRRGEDGLNLALLTDGLRAEREQNITIDVAYRYFATPKRKFIIADTPGHIQYTRNMVTGASTADLAIVLIDARKGIQTQSRRHGFIASLLRIPHVLVAVNKMDLVDFSEDVYLRIVDDYRRFAAQLDIEPPTFIPISALAGDNVVEKSERMPWYSGDTLLHHLETVSTGSSRHLADLRFPVQYVLRPHQDFRGFAGRIVSGTARPGDSLVVLPGGQRTRIDSIETADGAVEEAFASDSVVITLTDDIDVSRGDMLVHADSMPFVTTRFAATLCWVGDQPLDPTLPYLLMHTSRQVQAYVSALQYRIDVDTLQQETVRTLACNDIGRVEITTGHAIFFDAYDVDRATGSFILIDPHSNATVAAGMIAEPVRQDDGAAARLLERHVSPGVVSAGQNISREAREARNGHRAAVLWFTGLSGAGKSTIARALERTLYAEGRQTILLDGDDLRHGLSGDLGFDEADRRENIRRAAEVARLFFEQGNIVLCTFVSPYREDRGRVRSLIPEGRFFEVHVHADVETCAERDPKGLYARARTGEIRNLTGVNAPYEEPENPELRADTQAEEAETIVRTLISLLRQEGII